MWQWSRSAYELGSLEACSTWCEVLDKFCFQIGIMTWGRMLCIETDSWAKNEKTLQLLAVMGGAAPRSSARKALWPLVRRQLLQVLSSQMIFQGMVFSGDLYRCGIESFNCDGLRMSTCWYLFLVTGLASSRVSGRSIADCRATAEWQCWWCPCTPSRSPSPLYAYFSTNVLSLCSTLQVVWVRYTIVNNSST